jgi:hypothetical protein
MIEINQQQIGLGKELKRRGRGFVPANKLIRGGNLDFNSANLLEVNFVETVGLTGLVGQMVTAENPFGFETPSARVNFFGFGIGGLAMSADITPTITDYYNLGYPALKWNTVYAKTGNFQTVSLANGASGSFTTADGKTVTVSSGIITSIV